MQKNFWGKNDLFQNIYHKIFYMSKVIRLTENDLVKLVEKVVSERFEIMGELLSRAEEFLQENGIDSSNMDENEIYKNVDMLTKDENKRIRHSANRLKAEMIGFFGRQS